VVCVSVLKQNPEQYVCTSYKAQHAVAHVLKEHGQKTLKTLIYHFSLLEIWYITLPVFLKQAGMLPPQPMNQYWKTVNTVTEIMWLLNPSARQSKESNT